MAVQGVAGVAVELKEGEKTVRGGNSPGSGSGDRLDVYIPGSCGAA